MIAISSVAEGESGYRHLNQGGYSSSSGSNSGSYSWAGSYGVRALG